jgi:hypothetical protein
LLEVFKRHSLTLVVTAGALPLVVMQCWEHMASGGAATVRNKEHEFAAAYPFLQSPANKAVAGINDEAEEGDSAAEVAAVGGAATAAADRKLLLRFAQLLMLYQPPSAKGPANPLAAAQHAAAGGGGGRPQPMDVDGGAAPASAGLPPGMSRQDVAVVEGKAPPTGEVPWPRASVARPKARIDCLKLGSRRLQGLFRTFLSKFVRSAN